MNERKGLVTLKGGPLTLLGPELRPGDKAPDFTALGTDWAPVHLSSFKGKKVVISSVSSLDTAICDLQTRRFNQEAEKLGPDVVILTLSMDLPVAQARWCGAAGAKSVRTLSDHRDASFGQAFGLLIKESRLLARAVLIIDREGIVRYVQLVPEVGQEPDYEDALRALAKIP